MNEETGSGQSGEERKEGTEWDSGMEGDTNLAFAGIQVEADAKGSFIEGIRSWTGCPVRSSLSGEWNFLEACFVCIQIIPILK